MQKQKKLNFQEKSKGLSSNTDWDCCWPLPEEAETAECLPIQSYLLNPGLRSFSISVKNHPVSCVAWNRELPQWREPFKAGMHGRDAGRNHACPEIRGPALISHALLTHFRSSQTLIMNETKSTQIQAEWRAQNSVILFRENDRQYCISTFTDQNWHLLHGTMLGIARNSHAVHVCIKAWLPQNHSQPTSFETKTLCLLRNW